MLAGMVRPRPTLPRRQARIVERQDDRIGLDGFDHPVALPAMAMDAMRFGQEVAGEDVWHTVPHHPPLDNAIGKRH